MKLDFWPKSQSLTFQHAFDHFALVNDFLGKLPSETWNLPAVNLSVVPQNLPSHILQSFDKHHLNLLRSTSGKFQVPDYNFPRKSFTRAKWSKAHWKVKLWLFGQNQVPRVIFHQEMSNYETFHQETQKCKLGFKMENFHNLEFF